MIDRINDMLDILKSMKVPTSHVESDLGFSNGLLKKGSLSIEKYNRLVDYFNQFSKPTDKDFVFRIYKLIDPRDGKLFYIGRTRRTLVERLAGHIGEARSTSTSKKNKIIREILTSGLDLTIEIIEIIKSNCMVDAFRKSTERETYWAAKLNPIGNTENGLKKNHNVGEFAKSARKHVENNIIKGRKNGSKIIITRLKGQIMAQSGVILELEELVKAKDAIISELEAKLAAQPPNHIDHQKTSDMPPNQKSTANTSTKPQRLEGESGIDYSIRLAEWKDNQASKQ